MRGGNSRFTKKFFSAVIFAPIYTWSKNDFINYVKWHLTISPHHPPPTPLSGSYPSVIINPLGRECIPELMKLYSIENNLKELPNAWFLEVYTNTLCFQINFSGWFSEFFYLFYSTLLHLPPLRFRCVEGFSDQTVATMTLQSGALIARSHPQG